MDKFEHLEKFKLSKSQMNSISGGKSVKCVANIGGYIKEVSVHPDLSLEEAARSVEAAYGHDGSWGCMYK